MITRVRIQNFKLLEDVDLELDSRVVFVGPNNAGKTSILQGLALWSIGLRKWVEKRGDGSVPSSRSGVTINRRDLLAVPVPAANLLWRRTHTSETVRTDGKPKTANVQIIIDVDGVGPGGEAWTTSLEFDYANEESIYCRSRRIPSRASADGRRGEIPPDASSLHVAYLPPMSGLASTETRLDEGAIGVRVGEGRTAEVLRNLAWMVYERAPESWNDIARRLSALFDAQMEEPVYVRERGEVTLAYRDSSGTRLDISSAGRGQQQTLLLLTHMTVNPGALLLLDEPDAHLETLRQRETYRILSETAQATGSQLICASHSEAILDEAARRDTVISFVGKPHVAAGGVSQVRKALAEVSWSDYLSAEQTGWVLFLEGTTDLDFLRAFAERTDHPAAQHLQRPFAVYTEDLPNRAVDRFHALREAVPAIRGFGVYDRRDSLPAGGPSLSLRSWSRYEIENYLDLPGVLLRWARSGASAEAGDLFRDEWDRAMAATVRRLEDAEKVTHGDSPWSPTVKASDRIARTFQLFADEIPGAPIMRKGRFHQLVAYMEPDRVDAEVIGILDELVGVAEGGRR